MQCTLEFFFRKIGGYIFGRFRGQNMGSGHRTPKHRPSIKVYYIYVFKKKVTTVTLFEVWPQAASKLKLKNSPQGNI